MGRKMNLGYGILGGLVLPLLAGMAACGSDDKTSGKGTGPGDPAPAPGAPTGIGVKATDLAAPAPGTGVQFETPDDAYIVQPGQEIFPNFCVTVPADVDIGGFESLMTEGSSHHFILYQGGAAPANGACALGRGTWIYASSTPGEIIKQTLPAGVGLPIAANTQLVLNMHFINTGTGPLSAKIKINLLYAQNVQQKAGTMVSFNIGINVPAHATQTVNGTCSAPVGSKFFIMSTHTHKRATAATVSFVHGGQAQEIVHTGVPADGTSYPADQLEGSGTDWEHPGIGHWDEPNFLTVGQGDSFTYSCSYLNEGDVPVTVGETAASNEMCMAVGYYFPAGQASCR